MQFFVPLRDLEDIEGRSLQGGSDEQIVQRLRHVYDFLPAETTISVSDGIVSIDIPEHVISNKLEAIRLHEKASQRAKAGEYTKAINIWGRVLELDPTYVLARRDLGMALMEVNQIKQAKEHLIEAATLDPNDSWSYVVLGNILARNESDIVGATRFYKKALAINPKDSWAINSMGGIALEQEKWDEALNWFDQSIAINPKFANPYYGKSHAYAGKLEPEKALASIEQLFRDAELQDARSQPVFRAARDNYKNTHLALAKISLDKANEALGVYIEHIEDISGFPIKEERQGLTALLAGQTQMAWKKQRDHHLVHIRPQYPEALVPHIRAHEFTHIALEAEARSAGRNKWFGTTAVTRETALRAMADDIKKFERSGALANTQNTAEVIVQLLNGACGFIFNAPLDMIIEERIRERLPSIRHSQYCSLVQLASEAEYVTTQKETRELTPKLILRVNDTLNMVMALWLRDFTQGIADFTSSYRKFDCVPLADKLYKHFQARAKSGFQPGDEYDLVDEFAKQLKIRDWYQWIEDPGGMARRQTIEPDGNAATSPTGTTNPELLRSMDMASTMYIVAAMERFEKLQKKQVQQIAFEIAVLGMSGLDYASSDKKYKLNSLPDENFSGLELMALMHTGLKQVEPEASTGMDLDGAYEQAQVLYAARRGKK